ncbi:MAG TPA: polysaccharide biosynthesis protein GumE [Cellvibrio sp.]|nr:polysaccharide biosynthesis protein GumE [Cellvibrio sp.]
MTYPAATGGAIPGNFDARLAHQKSVEQKLAIAILLACIGYQAALCLLNTMVLPVSRAFIGAAELLIIAACVPLMAKRLLPGTVTLACMIAGILCVLTLVNGFFNAKAFRDLLIPIVFFWVGCNLGSMVVADKVVKAAFIMVAVLGLFELLLLDTYTEFFNIFSYYVNTGNLQPITDYVRDSKLQLNGIRPDGIGRTFFPGLLGSHRVSSVFLEPVSLGNFAVLCGAWGLSKSFSQWREMLYFMGAAGFLMVISDSRFAMASLSLMIAVRLLIHGSFLNFALLTPFLALAGLLYLGSIATGPTFEMSSDDFHGRLEFSGKVLLDFDLSTLLGVSNGVVYADVGYAHLFNTYSLPMCLVLWACFWLLPIADETSRRFRALAAIYLSLLLCISGFSFFALKSAALLWFLLGSSLQLPAPANPSASGATKP